MLKITDQIMVRAETFYNFGQIEQAFDIYKQVLQKEPANSRAWYALGKISLGKNDARQAASLLKQAIALDQNNPRFHNAMGVALEELGQIPNAVQSYKKAAELKPAYFEAYHNIAIAFMKTGQYEHAENNCRTAINIAPTFAAAHNTLGFILEQQNKPETALESYQRAISLKSDFAEPYNHIGVIFKSKGKTDLAVEYFSKALNADPNYAEAANNLGLTLAEQNKNAQAIKCFTAAIKANPQMHPAYFNLANIYSKTDSQSKAVEFYLKATQINPDYFEAYNNLGIIFYQQGQTKQAIEQYQKAIQLKPDFCDALINISIAETQEGMLEEAFEHAKKAAAVCPDKPENHYNLANTLKAAGNCPAALESYNRAIELKTDYPEAVWNKAITLLLSGELSEGFNQYKKRRDKRLNIFTYPNKISKPLYESGPLEGKRILVHWEQGLGDSIQLIRFLPLLKKRGAYVIFEERNSLINLFRNIDGVDELKTFKHNQIPEINYDMHVPLMDLPAILNTTLDSLPADVPYIRPEKHKSDYWNRKLSAKKVKAGIVWSGKPQHKNDHNRSCSLADFAPLADIEGLNIYSLQKGKPAEQINRYKHLINVENLSTEFADFSDTAAAIENLDIIISVDTSVLHLSGAMGKKTFALIPYHPDWRWMLNTERSPWYPTMKICRQTKWGCWKSVFESVCTEVNKIKTDKIKDEHK